MIKLLQFLFVIGVIWSTSLLAFGSAYADQCPRFQFSTQQKIVDWVHPSLAKVYDTQVGGNYHGTATLIDEAQGLILTASHVAKSDKVYVLFPFLGDNKRYPAKVVSRLEQSEKESTGEVWGRARDIAVLKLSEPISSLVAAEIWMDDLDPNETLNFFGFTGDAESPVHGASKASTPKPKNAGPEGADCTRNFRENIEAGDSGAPVIDKFGLVNGIVIARKNAGRAGKFIPSKCFSEFLISALGKKRARDTFLRISNSTKGSAVIMLKPPRRSEWLTNLEFAAALDAVSENKDLTFSKTRHQCPISPAARYRGIGGTRYERYILSTGKRAASALKKDANLNSLMLEADTLHRESQSFIENNNIKVGTVLLKAAVNAYDAVTSSQITAYSNFPFEKAMVQSDTPPWPLDVFKVFQLKEMPKKISDLVGRAFKSKADALIKLSTTQNSDEYLNLAQQSAAFAVTFATDQQSKAKAQATFAMASQSRGDYQTAIEAYSAAIDGGEDFRWVTKNYDWAFQQRDNVKSPKLAKDYMIAGQYRKIDDSLIVKFALGKDLSATREKYLGYVGKWHDM